MSSARLLDQPKFGLGSIGTRHVLEDLRDMILDVSTVGLEREIFVCTYLIEVFSTALRWDTGTTDLFVDTNRAKAFKAFHAFDYALGGNHRERFLRPLIETMQKFLERVAACEPRPLEVPEKLKESILEDLDRLIMRASHGNFALPAK